MRDTVVILLLKLPTFNFLSRGKFINKNGLPHTRLCQREKRSKKLRQKNCYFLYIIYIILY